MSPSESQLRAALHEGEGDALDAGLVIAHANRLRRDRRQRVNRLAGATLVIGLIGGGLMLLSRTSDDESGGGTSAGGSALRPARAKHKPATAAATAPSPTSGAGAGGYGLPAPSAESDAARFCPRVPDRVAVHGGLIQGGSSEDLVPFDTTLIRACAYPSGAPGKSLVLRAAKASSLASTVNAGLVRPTPSRRTCTGYEPSGTVELLPYSPHGKRAKPVVVTVSCPNAIATNGVVTRYFVIAPKLLTNLLR